MLECLRMPLSLDRIDEQVEVLPDPRVSFRLPQRGKPLQHAARGGVIAGDSAWLEVERRRIEALEPSDEACSGWKGPSDSNTIADMRLLRSTQERSSAASANGALSVPTSATKQ
jgi:hypothetical protein